MRGCLKGEYDVINKDKYCGIKNPRYLSSWELYVFKWFDENPNVIEWGAETVIVPYFSKADNKNRRYMVDLYVKYKDRQGKIVKELVEIKPYAQTQPPKVTKLKKQSTIINEAYTFQVNTDKWLAATKYAKERKMKFRLLTEKDIYK